jgi:sigma-B regulation protein RsbU (phosphoserine phosphatase)
VSGKGLPASLLMANLQATVSAHALSGYGCGEIVDRTNRHIFRNTAPEKFASFFLCSFDLEKDTICYTNAGHNPALLFPAGGDSPLLLKIGGIPLGIREQSSYLEETLSFTPGDLLVIYSDGITEARDAKEEEFGVGRLVDAVMENRGKPAEGLKEAIFDAVVAHVGDAPQHDDITMVVVNRVQA